MESIELVKGSDGSGNAEIATVQNIRTPGASTIIVDTVTGINPDGFAGSMGTPHTFTDPITSEVITVISEATAVDFTGHVDGSNLEIDDIGPGYVDNGSAVGDIVIIKPTTQYADNLAAVLEVAHDDDGTLKAGAVDAAAVLAANVVTTVKILNANVTPDKLATGAANASTPGQSTTTNVAYALLADGLSTADTVVIGANGLALVTLNSFISNGTAGGQAFVGFAVSGATTTAASDDKCVMLQMYSGGAEGYLSGAFLVTGLTPGSTTFTMQYKVGSTQTGTFKNRRIAVIPL